MLDIRACRSCLQTEGKLSRIPDAWYRIYENLTGVQAYKNDGYPNFLCVLCKGYVTKAIAFRKKARRAFYVLKEIMTLKKEVTVPDILTVDRSIANLKSGIGFWPIEKQAIFAAYPLPLEDESMILKQKIIIDNSCLVFGIDGDHGDSPGEPPTQQDGETVAPPAEPAGDDIEQGDNIGDDIEDTVPELPEEPAESEIDMEDIFKGLDEPESEKSDDDEELATNVIHVEDDDELVGKKKKGEKIGVPKDNKDIPIMTKALALSRAHIKLLTEEEQYEAFKKRSEILKKSFYVCVMCVEVFDTLEIFSLHFQYHQNKKDAQFLCNICRDKFISEEELSKHTRDMHLYQYTCKHCGVVLYTILDLVRHKHEKHDLMKFDKRTEGKQQKLSDVFDIIPLSEEEKVACFKKYASVKSKYNCDVCGMGFPFIKDIKNHALLHQRKITTEKNAEAVAQCKICGVFNKSENFLAAHMKRYHNYEYRCKMCTYETGHKLFADYHLNTFHALKECVCQYCGWKSKTIYGLKFHENGKHWPQIRKCHCVLCGYGAISWCRLYVHQFKEHNFIQLPEAPQEGAENACGHCKVQFLSKEAYYKHLIKAGHDELDVIPFKCVRCRKIFDSEEEEVYHKKSVCTKGGVYPSRCNICGETVDSQFNFYRHCKKFHPNYTCTLNKRKLCHSCGKSYYHKCGCSDAASGRYRCSICDTLFREPLNVILHVLKHHKKLAFSCNICTKAFNNRHTCKNHILKIHAPVKPYECPICNTAFSHMDFLKTHAKESHDVQVELDKKQMKRKKFYLYPNMRVDLSSIDKRIIEECKIAVADYTDQIFENVEDYREYVITNDDVVFHGEALAAPKKIRTKS